MVVINVSQVIIARNAVMDLIFTLEPVSINAQLDSLPKMEVVITALITAPCAQVLILVLTALKISLL